MFFALKFLSLLYLNQKCCYHLQTVANGRNCDKYNFDITHKYFLNDILYQY